MSRATKRKICTYVPFPTRAQAVEWMRKQAYSNKATGQTPIRVYHCPRCRKWHLTSKPQPKSKGRNNG